MLTTGNTVTVALAARTAPVAPPPGFGFVDNDVDGSTIALKAGAAVTTPIQLPAAANGSGDYTYSLREGIGRANVTDDANGLSVDMASLQLSGTPTTADADGSTGTVYYWRATDDVTKELTELSFTVTVAAADVKPPPLPDPTVITIAARSDNLAPVRLMRGDARTDVGPTTQYFELIVSSGTTKINPDWALDVTWPHRERFVENVADNTWTLQVWPRTDSTVSQGLWIYSRNSAQYRLQIEDPSDSTKHIPINAFVVTVDRDGPRIEDIDVYRLIPATGGEFNVRIIFNEELRSDSYSQ